MLWNPHPMARAALLARYGCPSRALRACKRAEQGLEPASDLEIAAAAAALQERRLVPWPAPDRWRQLGLPSVLLVHGSPPPCDGLSVAVVGARATDDYGEAVTRRVVRDAVELGAHVISGGADGVDGCAHETALAAGGRTWVVLGGGHDHPYPAAHRELFARASVCGGVLSAYWPTTRPAGFRFIARNRIIAALSDAVVVTRARRRSGSASTVRHARDLGRRILAVPGNVGESLSSGPNGLLSEGGATALTSPADLARALGVGGDVGLTEWPVTHHGDPDPFTSGPELGIETVDALPLDAATQTVKDAFVEHSTLDLDAVVMRTGLPAAVVVASLAWLQMTGDIQLLPGSRYRSR